MKGTPRPELAVEAAIPSEEGRRLEPLALVGTTCAQPRSETTVTTKSPLAINGNPGGNLPSS